MVRVNKRLIDPQITKEEFLQRLKNAIWTCEAFHFSLPNTLNWINGGVLGHRQNADGSIMMKDNKPVPITISMSTLKRHKGNFTELPQIYEDLRNFAMQGYTNLMMQFKAELETLHKMSIENVMAENPGNDRQQVIDSLVTKIMPVESAFSEMLKRMVDSGIIKFEKSEPLKLVQVIK